MVADIITDNQYFLDAFSDFKDSSITASDLEKSIDNIIWEDQRFLHAIDNIPGKITDLAIKKFKKTLISSRK